mmetsp:Transcript_20794/g.57119  ORF Transcript_20794/g.57119 Transcript_20794/m.57119 type:complete len:238 (+) Transcript_20794:570-1283(+)
MALCRHMPKRSIRSSPLCFQVVRAADGSRRPLPPPMQQDYLSLSDADSWVDTARPRPEDESGLVYAPGGAARGPEKPKFQAFSGGGQILGGGSGQPAMEVLGHGSEAEQLAQAMALSSDLAHRERLLARLPVEPTDSGARVLIRLPNGTRSHRRFPTDASLQAVVDFAAIELASIGASALNSSGSWSLVSQYPPFKLLFRSDGSLITEGSASCAEMGTKTVLDAGLVPSAQLHVAKA